MIMAPTRLSFSDLGAGSLFRGSTLPSLTLSLETGRRLFSAMSPLLRRGRLKMFHFELDPARDEEWPVRSWGMSCELGDGDWTEHRV